MKALKEISGHFVGVAVLLLACRLHNVSCDRFYILTSSSSSCPAQFTGEPCLTLQQFANNTGQSSNVVLLMEPGSHSLSSELSLSSVFNFTMLPQATSGNVRITCNTGTSNPSFTLTSIAHVQVRGITFEGCTSTFGMNGNSALISDVVFVSGGITVRNMTDSIELNNVTFTSCLTILIETSTSIQMRHINFAESERMTAQKASFISITDSLFEQASRTALQLYASPNVSVIRCRFVNNSRVDSTGSGLYVYQATVSVSDSTFDSNYAYSGSAIYASSSNLTIDRTNFTDNVGNLSGSIDVLASSKLTVSDSVFTNNTAKLGAAIAAGARVIKVVGTTFRNNVAVNMLSGKDYGSGGAMFTDAGKLVSLVNCTFDNNQAAHGGAISDQSTKEYVVDGCLFGSNVGSNSNGGAIRIMSTYGSLTTLTNSSFSGNTAGDRGGAVFTTGSLTAKRTNFTDNVASEKGGAITVWSTIGNTPVSISDSYFSNNRAGSSNGGAVYVESDNTAVQVNSCHFVRNTAASGTGGAIYQTGQSTNISLFGSTFESNSASSCGVVKIDNLDHRSVRLTGSTFTLNRATGNSEGGAVMCVSNASITLTASTFSYNHAALHAGVLMAEDSDVRVERCTFVNNSAESNGGVAYTTINPTTYSIRLSTFLNNSAGRDGGVLYVGRANSRVSVERSSCGSNHAVNRGGLAAIVGSSLSIDDFTNIYGNTASFGGAISACNSHVTAPAELAASEDSTNSVCQLYDGYIDRYNISDFIQQEFSTTTVAMTTEATTPPTTTTVATTTDETTPPTTTESTSETMVPTTQTTSGSPQSPHTSTTSSSDTGSNSTQGHTTQSATNDNTNGQNQNYAKLAVIISGVSLVLTVCLCALIAIFLVVKVLFSIVKRRGGRSYSVTEDNEFLLQETDNG